MGKIIHNGKIYSSSPQDVLDLETRMMKLVNGLNPLYPIIKETVETDVSNCIYYHESNIVITGEYNLSPAVFDANKSYVIAGHVESVTAKSGYTGAVDYRNLVSMPLILRQGSTDISTARISNTKEYSYDEVDSNASVTSDAVLRIYSGTTQNEGANYTATLQRLMIYEGTAENLSVVKSVVNIHDLRLYANSSTLGTFTINSSSIESYYNSIIINGKHYNILTFSVQMSQTTPMFIDLINSTIAYQLSGNTEYNSCMIVDDNNNVCSLKDILGDGIVDICFARDVNNLSTNDITKVVMRCDRYIN